MWARPGYPAGLMRRNFRGLLGAALSLVAVAGCVWWALGQDAPRLPDSASGYLLLIGALLLTGVLYLTRGWRWHLILGGGDVSHRTEDALGLTAVGYMGNTVLPARGGELLRIVLLSDRTGARHRQVLGSIVPERLLDAAALVLLFAAVTAAGIGGTPTGPLPALLGVAGLLLVVAGLGVYLRLRVAGRLQRFADRVRPLTRGTRQLLSMRGAGLLTLTLAVWMLEAVVLYLVTESLDLTVSVPDAMFVVVLVSFFSLIPAAPGYVGTLDAAALFGLDALGIGGGAALGCVLLWRFVIFVPVTVAGLILMVVRYGGLRVALRRVERVEARPVTAPEDLAVDREQQSDARRAPVASP